MTRKLLIVALLISLCGCEIIQHKDQLLTMADYSRDKNSQSKLVDQVNDHYNALVVVINSGKIKDYSDQAAILRNFGQPIAKKRIAVGLETQEQWLYCEGILQKAKDKVYLYFDAQGQLIKYTQEKIQW